MSLHERPAVSGACAAECEERMNNPSKEAKATKPAKPKFFQGVKAEFKKITWPDKELLLKQSVAVVAISIVLGAVIAVLDLVLQYAVDFLVK